MFDEIKKLIKHSVIYGTGNIASRIIGFFMIPVYTHYLTPSDYGIIEMLDLTLYIISMLVGLGIGSAVLRFYYDYDLEEEKREVVSTALMCILGISLMVALGLTFFISDITHLIFGSYQYTYYFSIMLITLIFSSGIEVPLVFLRAKQQSISFTAVSLARLILGLSLNIYLIVFLRLGILGVLYSSLISSAVICIFLAIKTFKEIRFHFSGDKLKNMLKYGLPLLPSSLGMFVIHFGDRYFLRHYSSLTSVGIYSLGYKFGMMLSFLIGQPFSLFWSARRYEIIKRSDGEQIYARTLTYFAFVLIFAALGLSILIKDLLRVIAAPSYYSAHIIVPVISLGYVLRGISDYFRGVLYIRKKTNYIGIIGGGTAMVSVILYYLLIPKLDVLGASYATVFTFLFMISTTYIISNKVYPMRYEFRRIILMLLVATTLFLVSNLVSTNDVHIRVGFKLLLILSFPFALLLLGFFRKEEKDRIISKMLASKLLGSFFRYKKGENGR